jgi:hypothetical protein
MKEVARTCRVNIILTVDRRDWWKGRESLRGEIEEKMIILPHSNQDAAHEDMGLENIPRRLKRKKPFELVTH